MAKENRKAVILVRHMAQKEIPDNKTFWEAEAWVDPARETYVKSAAMIQYFLTEYGFKLTAVESSSIIRAMQTAQGLVIKLLIENKWVNYSNVSGYLTPQIKAWEKLMEHFPASVENVDAMYAPGSEAKGLLMSEGYGLLEYIEKSLEEMDSCTAKIIVTHSPIIEATISAILNKWNEIPVSIKKGEAIALIFDEKNQFLDYGGIHLPFSGP